MISLLIERVQDAIRRVRAGGLKGAIAALGAALKRRLTNRKGGEALEREAATPKRGAAAPQRESATPKRESATPKRETATPERATVTPERATAILEREAALPEREAALPKRKPATPKRKAATPNRKKVAVSRAAPMIGGRYENAGGARRYKLFLPPQYRIRPLPLLLMLHGCGQDPDDFATGTRMNVAAAAHGFVVLYPAQARTANFSRCWNWFNPGHQHRDAGEPLLLAGMTLHVIERHGIDRQRVYVAGLSAGASMAAILGEARPDLFAAVGVFAGMPTGVANGAKSAFVAMKRGADAVAAVTGALPPTIVFHGDADRTVHPRNGQSIVERVVAAYGAVADPRPAAAETGTGCIVYRDGGNRPVAEHWLLPGRGHAWSGGDPAGSFAAADGPDASAEMLRFFAGHSLPPA